MKDWDILMYLRIERNWMVQSHYCRSDIEEMYEITFTDDKWEEFTNFACDLFDNVKKEMMDDIVECWLERQEE